MPIYKAEGKKDGKQRYRVRINYTDINGNARQIDRIAYGSAEAKALERNLMAEIKEAPPVSMRMTVRTLFDEYMAAKQHEVRKTTFDKSRRTLELHILPHIGSLPLNKLTRPALQEWKNTISALGFKVSSCNFIYKELNALLNYAVKLGHMPQNPLTALGRFKEVLFTEQEEKLQYYTPEEFKRYIHTANELCNTAIDRGCYVFFCIAYYTGMRKGEINALKWSDIEGNIIHVRRSIAQKAKGGDLETPPKNRSSYRSLQMPSPLISILCSWKAAQQLTPHWSEDFRVCGGIRPLRDTTLSNKNILFAEAAELPVLRIHDFRHSHASLLANEGINIQEIARRLGHSNVEITWKTYAHLYPREEERAIAILNKIIP